MSGRLGPWLRRQRKELVLAAIQGGCRLRKDILAATGLSESGVDTALATLKAEGAVRRAPGGWKLKEAPPPER